MNKMVACIYTEDFYSLHIYSLYIVKTDAGMLHHMYSILH